MVKKPSSTATRKKPAASDALDELRNDWRVMYTETLPKAAREKAPAQNKWIILDAVAGDTPWMEKIKSPAYKNMSEDQLRKALQLGQDILEGKANLVELDEQSLVLRGKKSKAAPTKKVLSKRKTPNEPLRQTTLSPATKKAKVDLTEDGHIDLTKDEEEDGVEKESKQQDRDELEAMIDSSEKSEFQKKCFKLLVQIPEGHFSTYGAMARALSSAPRAVGNAMRNNPFAPHVPCHRILASDRTIGGFSGDWGVEGKHYHEKMELLTKEGVKFDSQGKVIGPVFEGFTPV